MKEIRWPGSSYEDMCAFPVSARRDGGYQLHLVQNELDPTDWKPMTSVGSGVREIRVHQDGEYRVIYVAKFEEAIYVLHAFRKKTQRIRKQDIDIARERLKTIQAER